MLLCASTVAAITLGLVDPRSLPERFGRNAAFDRAGNLFIAGLVGLVGWRFSQHAVFYLVPLFAAVTSLVVLSIPRHAIDHERARGGLSGSNAADAHPSGWTVLVARKPLLVSRPRPRSSTSRMRRCYRCSGRSWRSPIPGKKPC